MLEKTSARLLPVVNRAADIAPAAQACCGVCRTCATTNVFGLAFAGIGLAAARAARLFRR